MDNLNKSDRRSDPQNDHQRACRPDGQIGVAASKINTVTDVARDPLVSGQACKGQRSKNGIRVDSRSTAGLQPRSSEANQRRLSFPPRFGEHNEAIYGSELGVSSDDLTVLKAEGII